jgi:acyl carrier protein
LTSCGYPWLGMSICIVNPQSCKPTPTNEIGEIWIKGPSVTKGYWNNDAGTEKTYRAFISGTKDGPWMRSGDLGFIHKGQLYVSGRLKELIILRGSNFFPNDLEYSIEHCHEAVRNNASAAFSSEIKNEEKLILLAEIERTHMRELNENEVFEAIRKTLFEEHGVQAHAIVLMRTGSTLKTSSGKTQRFAMKRAWLNSELNVLASWEMKTAKENGLIKEDYPPEKLHEWMINWMALTLELDPENIDPNKPVSAYGLDSISAVSLEHDVNKQFGVEWPIESFLKDNSVNQLVEEGILLLRNKK